MSEDSAPDPQPAPKVPQKEERKTLEEFIREKAPEVLKSIPRNQRPQLAKVTISQVLVRSGPLPDPEELAVYGQIIPNGADRIMKMAEDQSAHRMALERTVVMGQQQQGFRGQVFGLVIGLSGLGLATYSAVQGQPWFGSIIGGTTLVSLVSVFVYSQRKQQKELTDKRQEMEAVRAPSARKGRT